MVDETKIKKSKITKKDFEEIQTFVTDELGRREGRDTRKKMEKKWRVVDQMVEMEPPETAAKDGEEDDWHAAIQFGTLADAIEIIAADVVRISFPTERWFQPHIEIEGEVDPETGDRTVDPELQSISDGTLRAFMTQQHKDFGLRDRVKLSVKEALAHGGFVAEARPESMTKYGNNGQLSTKKAPVWVPHSMWNCYPDPSPSVIGTDLFYRGSMIIKEWCPLYKVKSNKTFFNTDKIETNKKDTEDCELIRYIGDLVLKRKGRDIFLPNYTVVLAEKTLVYAKQNDLEYSSIIYAGYEKDDVRTEYFSSPIIKRAPTAVLMTECGNRFIDGAEMKADPSTVYDAYDTNLVSEGGLNLHPGSSTGVKGGGANVKVIDIGDPTFMFTAYQELKQEVEKGTGVDATRSGVSASTEQTAFEVSKKDQKSETRTVDFQNVLDRQALAPFLYMQHDYNKKQLENYEFFNNEIHMPDFVRASKSDMPENVVFDVVGSKEVLGEEQRSAKFISAIQFSSSIPELQQRTNWENVTQEVWNFSGLKDPERFIVEADEMAEITQQFEQAMQELQAQVQEMAQEKMMDDEELLQMETDVNSLAEQIKAMEEQGQLKSQTFDALMKITKEQHKLELLRERVRQTQSKSSSS